MNPLHARYYADQAVQQTALIVENVCLAKDTFRVRFRAPTIARRIVPGQFVMLRLADFNDPLIGRPLALYDTVLGEDGRPESVDVVYLVKGKLTSRLWQMQPGQPLDVWGPLGNGFCEEGFCEESGDRGQGSGFRVQGSGVRGQEPGARDQGPATHHSLLTTHHSSSATGYHLIMVAGGIGQTPFLAVAQEALGKKQYGDPPRTMPRARQVTFCYGARTAEYLAGVEDFEQLGVDVRISTDDGSRGQHGFVTDLLPHALADDHGRRRIVCCGPEPMMQAVAKIAREAHVPCQVSLETPMACGIGICFTCVAKVRQTDGSWDYKRTCVDGPVFDAAAIEW